MDKSAMSVLELSEQLGISLPKAYELTHTSGFPVVRVGTRIIIPVDGFQKWLSDKAMKGGKQL